MGNAGAGSEPTGVGPGGYTRATEGDHRPATDFAGSAGRGGAAADASAEANVDGANGIARFSQDEITELMEVPDPDSPGGIAATLKIIEKYQGKAFPRWNGGRRRNRRTPCRWRARC